MKQNKSSPQASNKAKRQAAHHEKRKSMKFQFKKQVKASKKNSKSAGDEDEENNNQGFDLADEDKFVVASDDESVGDMEVGHALNDQKEEADQSDDSDDNEDSEEEENDDDDDDSDIYDPALHKQKLKEQGKPQHPPLLIILDLASLETVKTKKGDFQLLNCDDHIGLIRKFHKDPSEYRPDIIHQELMTVLDSPLNKAGKIKVIVHTEKNVLFEVSNKTRIPRTFKRFSGLMVQLLHRLKIRSADGRDMLLKVIKNPISRYIPAGARCVGFSDQGTFQTCMQFAKTLPSIKEEKNSPPTVLVFGAQATKGILKEDHPYIEELVSISNHGLSGVVAINRVLGAIETHWNIN